jgi:hypothetical protein
MQGVGCPADLKLPTAAESLPGFVAAHTPTHFHKEFPTTCIGQLLAAFHSVG